MAAASARLPSVDELSRFVARHKIVTEAARCRVPSVVHWMAPAPAKGSWWAWPGANRIYNRLTKLREHEDVLVCKLVHGKVTYVHASAWPSLVRLRSAFPETALDRVIETHGDDGRHATRVVKLEEWLPPDVALAASRLSAADAQATLAAGVPDAAALLADLAITTPRA